MWDIESYIDWKVNRKRSYEFIDYSEGCFMLLLGEVSEAVNVELLENILFCHVNKYRLSHLQHLIVSTLSQNIFHDGACDQPFVELFGSYVS